LKSNSGFLKTGRQNGFNKSYSGLFPITFLAYKSNLPAANPTGQWMGRPEHKARQLRSGKTGKAGHGTKVALKCS